MITTKIFCVVLLLTAVAVGCSAQIAVASTVNPSLRLVGTNLFDFSQAGPGYHIVGVVTKVFPQSVEVSIPVAQGFRLKSGANAGVVDQGPGEMLKSLYAIQAGTNPDGSLRLISLGQLLSMSPDLRTLYEPATDYKKFYLLNAPNTHLGQPVNATAIPTANAGFYDCGVQITGATNDFTFICRLVGNRILKTAIPSSTRAIPTLNVTAPASRTIHEN